MLRPPSLAYRQIARLGTALAGLAVLAGGILAAPILLPAQTADPEPSPVSYAERALFRHLTTEDGLSNEGITSVLQDRWGFLWIGTFDGLDRYDGYDIVEYRRGRDSTTISDNFVTALAEAPDGALWVGTRRGLNRLDRETETFTLFPRERGGLPDDDVIALHADSSGHVWVGTAEGLGRYDPETDAWTVYRHDPSDPASLPHDNVTAIVPGPRGSIWVGTSEGVSRLDPDSGQFRTFRTAPEGELFGGEVSSLAFSERGHLWVGTFGSGLFRLDPSRDDLAPVDLGSVSVISTVYEDEQGTLWVGTFGDGLRQLDPGAAAPIEYVATEADPTALIDDSVSDIFQDRQGVLWVATYGGLDRFDRARGTVSRFRTDPADPTSLASNDVMALLVSRDNTLYVGTDRSVDVRTGDEAFRSFPLRGEVGDAAALALLQDQAGVLWAGTEVGLRRVTPSGLESVALDAVPGGTPVKALLEDRAGRFFVGTLDGGLVLLDREAGQSVAYTHSPDDPSSLAHDNVRALAEDARGTLWVGTAEGLCRLGSVAETAQFTCFRGAPGDPDALASGFINALHAREDGSLWVGTSAGLHRVDTDAPERGIQRFTEAETDLPSDDVLAIVEDDDGFLWISTSRGLARFEPVTATFQQRTLGGEGTARTLGGAATRGPDGTLYFGGTNGLLAFEPTQLAALNPNPPQVAITAVLLGNEPIEPGEDSPLQVAAPLAERLRLAHDQNYVTIRFAGLHFSAPEQNRYRYRMEGLNDDDEWIESGRRREAPYPSLAPGRYTFRVQAASADGLWSETGASLSVVVSPPWWRSTWAYLAYAALFVVGLVRFDRWQRARVLRQERERAERREQEIRAETAEAEARKAEADRQRAEAEADRQRAETRAARAEADRQRAEAEGKRELEKAFSELKATQTQLVQSEKLASLGQLTAGIAHEIKNPLNFVNNFADLSVELADELGEELRENKDKPVSAILEDVDALLDDLRENSRRIHEHGTRADRIVKAMLLHSRGSAAEKARVDANRFVEEYANLAYHGARANDKEFQVDLVRDLDPAAGDVELIPQELGRVLINLLSNAFYAVGQRRKIDNADYEPTVTVATRHLAEGASDWIEIRVADNGTGIPDGVRQKVFEPFFTTKPTGEGTGLGLSLAYEIVTQGHGGTMSVESEESQGTEFSIRLPARGTATNSGEETATSEVSPESSTT
ncbi:MAG: two-component regulator propeller domain-containing protein [Bacteroidota bacterium]